MRVIAGQYKGAKLISPRGDVRPTTDLVKGSLFSVLDSKGLIVGARCLDVFCGSGALGIEALSRGAEDCVFIDAYTGNVRANADKLKISARIVQADFRRALRSLRGERFELVFCDPPYKTDYAEEVYSLLVKYDMLASGGVAVLEHAKDRDIALPGEAVIEHRVFGASAYYLVGAAVNKQNNDEEDT